MSLQKTILCLMDYGPEDITKTGFATVSRNIKNHIKAHFGPLIKLHIVGTNYFGEPYEEPDGTTVLSAKRLDGKEDDFGRNEFLLILKNLEYDGVFIMFDLGIIQPIIEIMDYIKQKKAEAKQKVFKSIFYFPVDCHLFADLTKGLEFFDLLVTYTEFGRKEIIKFRPELKQKLKVIPHGNNSNDFYPVSGIKKADFRVSFFGDNCEKFIISNINRNQPRKDICNTIFAFIEVKRVFKEYKMPREPFLYLHCHPQDPLGQDLRAILMQTELEEEVDYKLIPQAWEHNMASIEELNLVYNASDLYLTTTLGEGWGLSVTEAFAAKLPVICPDNTSLSEISGYGSRAWLCETQIPFCSPADNIIRYQTDYMEVAQLIVDVAGKIMTDSPVVKEKVEQAFVYSRFLEWEKVCERWIEYWDKIY